VIDGQVAGPVGRTLVARAPVATLATPGAEHPGAETLPGPRAVEGVVPAAVGLPGVLGAATASAAGDDTTDRAQLHPQIVDGLAGAVYSPAVLRLRDHGVDRFRNRARETRAGNAGQARSRVVSPDDRSLIADAAGDEWPRQPRQITQTEVTRGSVPVALAGEDDDPGGIEHVDHLLEEGRHIPHLGHPERAVRASVRISPTQWKQVPPRTPAVPRTDPVWDSPDKTSPLLMIPVTNVPSYAHRASGIA